MKTTKKDFEYFKECVNKWMDYFGIKRYHISFKHCDIGDSYAAYQVNEVAKYVVFKLSDNIEEEHIYEGWIDRTAFHEVVHIFINRLSALADSRYSTPTEMEEAEHDIIITLENTLLQDLTK